MKLNIEVITQVETTEVGILNNTILIEISERRDVADAIRAGRHSNDVAVCKAVASHQALLPIDDWESIRIKEVVFTVVCDVLRRVGELCKAIICLGNALESHKVLRTNYIWIDNRVLPTYITTISYIELILSSTLCGDEDYTVCSTRTVDSC